MNVYYWRTWYKAVCGGKGGSEGHVLRDTTSRGLRGVCPPDVVVYYCRTYEKAVSGDRPDVVVYYCRIYMKAVRGGGVKRGDVCYGMLRAAACVDESDHHALMYVWHGQIVREDRVGEASARRP